MEQPKLPTSSLCLSLHPVFHWPHSLQPPASSLPLLSCHKSALLHSGLRSAHEIGGGQGDGGGERLWRGSLELHALRPSPLVTPPNELQAPLLPLPGKRKVRLGEIGLGS
uniref:Uncharacterized protein n=1 Tax=Oryza rufipogon TaxID=4529 RepID=A0A0E0QX82_ORYRU